MKKLHYPKGAGNLSASIITGSLHFKRKAMLCLTLLGFFLTLKQQGFAQTQVIVGTGTSLNATTSIFSTSTTTNKYAKNIAIYSAAEIIAAGGTAGNITHIAWNKNGTGEYPAADIQLTVSIKPVSFTTHASSPITFATELTGATTVFTSNAYQFMTGTGWNEIVLQTPFLWDGSSNLEVFVDFYRPSTPTASITWQFTTVTNANATDIGSTPSTTVTRSSSRPNVRFTIAPNAACTAPPTPGTAAASAATVCANTNFNLSLSGNSTGSGQTYQWETSANGTSGWTAVGTASNASLLTTTQTSGTHYYRAAVTCSGQTAYSNVISVNTPANISGTYSINKNAAASATNFVSFTDAVNFMSCGITGPVTFNVVIGSGPYTEQVEIPAINGASATNTITFNGNSQKISADPVTGNRAVIRLNGADFIIIDSLLIETSGTTSSSFGWGIHLINGADNNIIRNCGISIGSESTTEANSAGIVFSNSMTAVITNGDNGSNNIISGNTITGGWKSIHLNANANATTPNAGNNQIINNILRDFYTTGIELDQAIGTLIKNNNISRPTRNASPISVYMVYLGDDTHTTIVDGNRIHNPHGGMTGATTGGAYGVYATGADAAAGSENIVRNNLIYNFNNPGTMNALYNSSSDGIYYYHNTINLDNAAHTGFARGLYQTGSASNIKLINNNISITTGGVAGNLQGIYLNTLASTIESNNNNLYVPTGNIGNYNSIDYATLTTWQAANASAPFDANSVAVNPNFVSPTTGNLMPANSLLNNAGVFIAAADTDIMGVTRIAPTTDLGAYEFTPASVGISKNMAGRSILVYPNPSNGKFDVKLTGFAKDAAIALYNVTGQLIATETAKGNAKGTVKKLDVGNLPAGVYMLKVSSENAVTVTRLVVE